MTLIVEDGTMPGGANAYCGLDFADGWHSVRGNSDWPAGPDADGAAKAAALIRAADYLNGLSWSGRRAKAPAPRLMAWPREGAVDTDGGAIPADSVPPAVMAANALLARLALSGTELQPVLERGGRIQSESVGSLSTSYFDDAPARDVYTALADLLGGLCSDFDKSGGTSYIKVTT